VSWIARVGELEVALAERDLGDDPSARIARVRAELPALHREATQHYGALLGCSVDALADTLDGVYY
jgi:hypothetical protein